MTLLARPIVVMVAFLSLLLQPVIGLRVREVASPVRPADALGIGITVLDVRLDGNERPHSQVVWGRHPFIEPALESLRKWSFGSPTGPSSAFTSVTFLFRPTSPGPEHLSMEMGQSFPTSGSNPAIPTRVVDPGYPTVCVGSGTAILQVQVSANGNVTRVETLSGPVAMTEAATQAVKLWSFMPARLQGKPVASTAYIVVSFLRPLI